MLINDLKMETVSEGSLFIETEELDYIAPVAGKGGQRTREEVQRGQGPSYQLDYQIVGYMVSENPIVLQGNRRLTDIYFCLYGVE